MRTRLEEGWLECLEGEAKPSIDDCVNTLGASFQWLKQLKATPQDPEWHGEGDVHIHTGMVLNELYRLLDNEAAHIKGWKRQALILAALFHDIGKTQRTKNMEIKGVIRVASPQHESVGRSYLAFKLMDLGLQFKVVWTVLGLVGEHHMPKLLVVKDLPKGDYLALSRRANMELLYWLEVADMKGRICPDLPKQLTILEEYRMFTEDYGLWQKPFNLEASLLPLVKNDSEAAQQYVNSHAIRGLEQGFISQPEEALAKAYQDRNAYSNLVVLCGPSGVGKSTWITRNCHDYQVISLDEIREEINGCRTNQKNKGQVIHLAKDRLKIYLRAKQNVVWDATNLRSDFRKIICDFGRDYNALVTLVVFLSSEKEIRSGNNNRAYSVPEGVLNKQFADYQFPIVNEAHRYCIINSHTEALFQSGYFLQQVELHYEQ